MIILEGPDGSGKTTLAKELGLPYYHFDQNSGYNAYLPSLCGLEFWNAVLDRHAFSECPYSSVMGRKFRFGLKEWHNLILLTLIQNPVIILCTHKPLEKDYPVNQYMPYNKWDLCLGKYREFFNTNHITHAEYDYTRDSHEIIKSLLRLNETFKNHAAWWVPMFKAGWGCTGSTTPKVLLVAERIGPNNVDNLPFQCGPTGQMLSDLIYESKTPLGIITIANMVKGPRRDPRPPSKLDQKLLSEEIDHLKPKIVVFMGRVSAQAGIPVAKDHNVQYESITHLGYYNHRMIKDVRATPLLQQWKDIIGVI